MCVCVCAHVQIYRGDKFYTNGAREKTNRLEVKSLSKEEPTICNFAPYAVVRLDREGGAELATPDERPNWDCNTEEGRGHL